MEKGIQHHGLRKHFLWTDTRFRTSGIIVTAKHKVIHHRASSLPVYRILPLRPQGKRGRLVGRIREPSSSYNWDIFPQDLGALCLSSWKANSEDEDFLWIIFRKTLPNFQFHKKWFIALDFLPPVISHLVWNLEVSKRISPLIKWWYRAVFHATGGPPVNK